jgi:site-specific DNA-methyltransferase (adenine-specific)
MTPIADYYNLLQLKNKIAYQDNYIIHYLAEMEDIICKLPSKSINLIFTDPPYLLKGNKIMGWDGGRDYVTDIDQNGFADDFNYENLDILNNLCINPNMAFFCNKAQIPSYIKKVEQFKLNWNILSWHKPNCIPIGNLYLLDTEFIFHMWKDLKVKKSPVNTFWMHNIVTGEAADIHPTAKPERIVADIIRQLTDEGDIVLDCFSGTGTTAVCCKRLKRKCISIEHNKVYSDFSIERYKHTEAGVEQRGF